MPHLSLSTTISRRTLLRFLPTVLLLVISLLSLSILEFSSLQQPSFRSSLLDTRQKSARHRTKMAPPALALNFITIPPRVTHTASIIFSHGLGDSGEGWRPVAHMLASQFPHVKWVLPHAPNRPVTINGGMVMPAWFDIFSLGRADDQEDDEGLIRSAAAIAQLAKAENDAGIPNEKIVIGGFSQGAALSLVAGLTSEKKFAGLAILSGWLPIRDKLASMFSEHATSTPIFWGHGTSDPIVPYKFGAGSVQILKDTANFKNIEFKSYQGLGHSADNQEIADLGAWLKKVIPA